MKLYIQTHTSAIRIDEAEHIGLLHAECARSCDMMHVLPDHKWILCSSRSDPTGTVYASTMAVGIPGDTEPRGPSAQNYTPPHYDRLLAGFYTWGNAQDALSQVANALHRAELRDYGVVDPAIPPVPMLDIRELITANPPAEEDESGRTRMIDLTGHFGPAPPAPTGLVAARGTEGLVSNHPVAYEDINWDAERAAMERETERERAEPVDTMSRAQSALQTRIRARDAARRDQDVDTRPETGDDGPVDIAGNRDDGVRDDPPQAEAPPLASYTRDRGGRESEGDRHIGALDTLRDYAMLRSSVILDFVERGHRLIDINPTRYRSLCAHFAGLGVRQVDMAGIFQDSLPIQLWVAHGLLPDCVTSTTEDLRRPAGDILWRTLTGDRRLQLLSESVGGRASSEFYELTSQRGRPAANRAQEPEPIGVPYDPTESYDSPG